MGAPKGGDPETWGPRRWGPRNFALFFPSPPQFSFFLLSLGGPFVEIWECLKRRGPEICTFGCRVKPRRPRSRRGFTRQPESPNVHISGPRPSKHHQNSTNRHPRERGKRAKIVAGEGKKRAKFWAVRRKVGPAESGENAQNTAHKSTTKQHNTTKTTRHNTRHPTTQHTNHTDVVFFVPNSVFYFVPMSFFILSRVFVLFVPFAFFFCPDNRLLILSRFCFFLSRCVFFCPATVLGGFRGFMGFRGFRKVNREEGGGAKAKCHMGKNRTSPHCFTKLSSFRRCPCAVVHSSTHCTSRSFHLCEARFGCLIQFTCEHALHCTSSCPIRGTGVCPSF